MNIQDELFPELNFSKPAKKKDKPTKKKTHYNAKDLTGETFGMLTVERMTNERHHQMVVFECRCECGQLIKVTARHLKRSQGPATHCGCQGVGRGQWPQPGKLGISGRLTRVTTSNSTIAFNGLYATYRNNAIKRGLEWSLTKKQFRDFTESDCHYCGAKPSNKMVRHVHEYIYNGIDRMDSDKGYYPENCVTCCWTCNQMKGVSSYDDLTGWIKKVYERLDL